MNADELALLCSALSVKEMDRPIRTLDSNLINIGARRLSLCLVGKVLTTRLVNRSAFIDIMTSVWRVSEGVDIEWAEGNIFVLNFKNLEDRSRILAGGPWNFDRAIIVFEEPTGVGDILNMSFNRTEFWVQIHNLPLLCMTEDIGMFLGKMIGEVCDIDLEAAREGNGRFIRVRVAFAANEPLLRCLRVDLLGTGKVTTMLLRYERLLDFCFKCSRLGHSMRECTEEADVKEATSEANVRLNVWLRAVSPSKRFPGRNRGFDQGSWGRQSGIATNSNSRINPRPSNRWQGKNVAMEKDSSGERWRKKCQVPAQQKFEGCFGSSNRRMDSGKGINKVIKKGVPWEKDCGDSTSKVGVRQKEFVETNDNQCRRVSGGIENPNIQFNNADLGNRNDRAVSVGGSVKEDSSSSRKRDGDASVVDGRSDRKKKKKVVGCEDSTVAMVSLEATNSKDESEVGCVLSNMQNVVGSVPPKSVTDRSE
ncbi:hypothetical protein EZV62_028104 [Acer yangbiense]|uniref:CCHC-type domain-containing protein n=1 Tax=Acer yangbiense TaxID=1000413 RepID=A0A5C7GQA1_9ROSI|nr:hypothetical protein EZV62_028104 [Acer yangbiense]